MWVFFAGGAVMQPVYFATSHGREDWNAIYESNFMPDKLPARTCIGVTGLAVGASVEIDLIAKL